MSSENKVIPLPQPERTVVLGDVVAWRRESGFQLVREPVQASENTLALPTSVDTPEPPDGPDTPPASALRPDRQIAPVVTLNTQTEIRTSPLAGVASFMRRLGDVTRATSETGQTRIANRSQAKAAA